MTTNAVAKVGCFYYSTKWNSFVSMLPIGPVLQE